MRMGSTVWPHLTCAAFLASVLLAQEVWHDALIPELPPAQLVILEGHYAVQWDGTGSYRDSSVEAEAWASRIPWEEGQEWYPPTPAVTPGPLTIQKATYTYVYLYSWQLHRSGKRLRLYSTPPAYSAVPQPPLRQTTQTWKTQSVLASGQWYKIHTGPAGVYRIDRNTLQALGIDPTTADPRRLRLYGQVGGLLPQENNLPAPDDLEEIPLYFPGESDGTWDANDAAYFYADSPDSWYPWPNRTFFHLKNPHTDSCTYFLTFDLGPGKRLTTQPFSPGSATPTNQVLTLYFHEQELVNLVKSGRVWLGETFDAYQPSRTFVLPLPACDSVRLFIQVAASSLSGATFTVQAGSATLGTISVAAIPGPADSYYARWGSLLRTLTSTSANLPIQLTYSGRSDSKGYLNYIEAIAYHPLTWQSGQQIFRVRAGTGPWEVQGTGPRKKLWDVTNPLEPVEVPLFQTASGYSFFSPGDTLRTYCAFEEGAAYAPTPGGPVANQNLHALSGIRYVIATTRELAPLCQRLCELNNSWSPCTVVAIEDVYNEFSGGRPDICALRNFLRMLYERASSPAEAPAFLLLVGQASYNLRKVGGTFLPTYQSRESFYPPETYGSDDFFGFLDSNEGFWGENTPAGQYDPRNTGVRSHGLDLGICRLPVYSPQDLQTYIDKLSDYLTNPEAQGPWLRQSIFFTDYKDNGLHTSQGETLAETFRQGLGYPEVSKIYIDIFPAQPQASGLSFPQAREALLNRLGQGGLFAHYVGHGNEYALQGFDFFPIPTVRQMQNRHRYLTFITATCEWGKWDDPSVRGGGVEALFLPQRGAIALLTSTRKVFAHLNFALSQNFYAYLLSTYRPQKQVLFGDLMRETKNRSWNNAGAINSRSFSFLGVPTLPLRLPTYKAVITQINSLPPSGTNPDTLRPLRPIQISGEIQDSTGQLVPTFEGEVSLRIWDKSISRSTLISRTPYQSQEVLLFSGRATVTSGRFQLTAYIPIDIIPTPGLGRMTLWAQSPDGSSAAGAETRFVICCPDTLPPPTTPPTIRLYINDTTWIAGSITHPNPTLIAYITDSLGINLSPLAVGKELKATLNGRDIYLSSYYETERDQPNKGRVSYRFFDLAPGTYHLSLEAWNLAGQKATASTTFTVQENATLRITRLFNYPNPFTTHTRFLIEHTQPGQSLDARLTIYTLTGRRIKTLTTTLHSATNLSFGDLTWDGLDEFGDKLARGVYLYRLELRNPQTGETASAQEKLLLLR
jgi:hypothetical protein